MTAGPADPPPISTVSSCSLLCGDRELDLSRVQVMGVLNLTPDSFSDGGKWLSGDGPRLERILPGVEQMLRDGAAIIDVGGESTRPGARPVTVQQELDRVIPVVEAISNHFDAVISVDTSSPEVMRAAAAAGAGMINDVRALEREGALAAVADCGLPVCLMHMQGAPVDMQNDPHYEDVVIEVIDYLKGRVHIAMQAGIRQGAILLDPGFGFGKTVDHNLRLLNQLHRLAALEYPVVVGLSRKSLIGRLLNREIDERLAGSLALAVIAAERGASIVRCHDVRETVDALALLDWVRREHFEH